jgi:hypothetical protein
MLKWYGTEVLEKTFKAIAMGIDETTIACVREAKPNAPKDTTLLQGAIQMRPAVKKNITVSGEWGAFNNKYALYVELGTDPHYPPVSALRGWARRKLGDENLAYAVVKAIGKKGTKPQPFLRPAADREYPNLAGRIKARYGS